MGGGRSSLGGSTKSDAMSLAVIKFRRRKVARDVAVRRKTHTRSRLLREEMFFRSTEKTVCERLVPLLQGIPSSR